MGQSTIALVIAACIIVLYTTEKLPLSITTILAMIAMVFAGILTPGEAFAGFSSTATILLIGISIIGEAFLTSGLVDRMGNGLLRIAQIPLPLFVALIFLIGSAMSVFLNGLAVVAIFIPILDAIEAKTEGRVPLKYTLMPLSFGGVLGGNLSVVGSTAMINASNLLGESYFGRPFDFFEPAVVAFPAVLGAAVFYLVIGQRLQEKCFDFTEKKMEKKGYHGAHLIPAWKSVFTIVVMALCVVGFVSGMDLGAVSLAGAVAVIVTGCIGKKEAYDSIKWETVFVVAGAIGFAKGLEISGAGAILANAILKLCGPLAANEYGMCVVFLVLSTVLSNFMSNNAAVTIILPIELAIASQTGYNPLPFALACGIGVNLSLATPICTACVTMTTVAGYRFKDYVRIGGIVNVLGTVVTAAAFYVVYYN